MHALTVTSPVPLFFLSGARLFVLQARHFAVHHDTLPRREGDISRRAVGLAEAALNAAVD